MKAAKKKIFFSILFTVLFIYILWLAYNLIGFRSYQIPESNHSKLEAEGIFHIHTTSSDGHRSTEKIAQVASKLSLDFIILTDHDDKGMPNSSYLNQEGRIKNVLVITGTEFSVSRGHLVGLDFGSQRDHFPQKAENAAFKIKARGGFSVIAHPYSKVQWTWGEYAGYSGIEILNADQILKKSPLSLMVHLPLFAVKSECFLLKMISSPSKTLKKWDQLNRTYNVYGYYSTDAHLFYKPLFQFLRLHVLLENPLSPDFEEAKDQILQALRKGRFFCSIDAAAQSTGFRFWCEKEGRKFSQGSIVRCDNPLILKIKAPFPFKKEMKLIHNGEEILNFEESDASYPIEKPGTYRVEVYLREKTPLKNDIPWIISNPIFIKRKTS